MKTEGRPVGLEYFPHFEKKKKKKSNGIFNKKAKAMYGNQLHH
jgi:hypothetical protein